MLYWALVLTKPFSNQWSMRAISYQVPVYLVISKPVIGRMCVGTVTAQPAIPTPEASATPLSNAARRDTARGAFAKAKYDMNPPA